MSPLRLSRLLLSHAVCDLSYARTCWHARAGPLSSHVLAVSFCMCRPFRSSRIWPSLFARAGPRAPHVLALSFRTRTLPLSLTTLLFPSLLPRSIHHFDRCSRTFWPSSRSRSRAALEALSHLKILHRGAARNALPLLRPHKVRRQGATQRCNTKAQHIGAPPTPAPWCGATGLPLAGLLARPLTSAHTPTHCEQPVQGPECAHRPVPYCTSMDLMHSQDRS